MVDVTPQEFLEELLSVFPRGTLAWITRFESADHGKWRGEPVRPSRLPDLEGLNAYYSTAGFERDARSRRVEEMVGVGVIVVDDPTQKGDAAALFDALGRPSFKIQTSRKNQQWGYLLDRPASNEEVSPILRRVVSLGLGDASGNNAVRYARLPAGINNKREYGETFDVRCLSWKPQRRFSVEQIAQALSVRSSKDRESKDRATFERVPDEEIEGQVRSGRTYHSAVLTLAARWIAQGLRADEVKARLRDLMESCDEELKSQDRWRKTYDDIDRNVDSAVSKNWAPRGRRQLEDFVSHLPTHTYFFLPTGALWPAGSVDACVTSPVSGDKKVRPSAWLDRHRPVHSTTWSPSDPQLVTGRVAVLGGWKADPNAITINLYQPPSIDDGDAEKAARWLDHINKVFPNDADHIVRWFAHRVQFPGTKINHALVMCGDQGVGKDTLLEPLKRAVGEWNFQEVGPTTILSDFNGFAKSVVLRISEARDLGPTDRFSFYEHMKVYTAAPPDTIRCNEKHLREHYVFNVTGVVITTNHRSDGIYLPPDDRRHYVAMSTLTKDDFDEDYWRKLWSWYRDRRGLAHVAAYLRGFDLSDFDPAAPPPKTQAWQTIVAANNAPEDTELGSAIEDLGEPDALTLELLRSKGSGELQEFLSDARNRRAISHRLIATGYVPVANPEAKNGLWRIGSEKVTVYAKRTLTPADAIRAARQLASSISQKGRVSQVKGPKDDDGDVI